MALLINHKLERLALVVPERHVESIGLLHHAVERRLLLHPREHIWQRVQAVRLAHHALVTATHFEESLPVRFLLAHRRDKPVDRAVLGEGMVDDARRGGRTRVRFVVENLHLEKSALVLRLAPGARLLPRPLVSLHGELEADARRVSGVHVGVVSRRFVQLLENPGRLTLRIGVARNVVVELPFALLDSREALGIVRLRLAQAGVKRSLRRVEVEGDRLETRSDVAVSRHLAPRDVARIVSE
mmetsp:Transcript_13439/g.44271  ORF Transcript_13439/g.44271 Transcript_13439/m.44271 type:complete len:242 (+) Transcript_13439:3589-4314(+)